MKTPLRTGPRQEWKKPLDPERTEALIEWACANLEPDPHVAHCDRPEYTTESIYFDTPNLDGFHRRGRVVLPRYRLRRYDGNGNLFLEEKLRRGTKVWKRRLRGSEGSIGDVLWGSRPLEGEGEWFRRRFRTLDLRPTVVVAYIRTALVGPEGERLTVDRAIHARRAEQNGRAIKYGSGGISLLADGHVVELKFDKKPTALIRQLVKFFDSAPTACSKYGLGVRSFGVETLT